jgi:hypothetical protein
MAVIVWKLDLQLSMQSMPIPTKVVSTTMTFQLVFDTSLNRNSGVTVSIFASSVVDPGIEPRSCQTKDYKQQSLTLLISHFN